MKYLWTLLFALLLAVPVEAAPTKLAQQGRVLDSEGAPLEGTHSMLFVLYDAATDGAAVWTEERIGEFDTGYYSITLGDQVPLDDLLFDTESVWLELSIDGETLAPRQEVVSVPYALRATAAEHVEGGMVDAAEISVDGTVVIDASGNWVGPTPTVGWSDLADIPADIADGDQDTDTDTLAGLACAEGQLPKWDAASSLWVCGDDIDTDTTDPNTDVLAGLPCADGYLAKFNGAAGLWDCAPDADTFADLAGVCLPGDIPVLDPVIGGWICGTDTDTITSSLPWSSITGVPADLADGDQDTITSSLPWSSITGIPADLADGDQDTQLSSVPWTMLTGVPADLADGDDVLSEMQVENMVTNSPLDLAPGTTVGGAAIATLDQSGDLSVAGSIESTSGGFTFPDGSTQTTAAAGAPGTVIYTRCAWTGASAESIGSCTPPTCPSGWSGLGLTGNVKTEAGTASGYGSSSTSVTESAGYRERGCYLATPTAVLVTRCAWTGASAESIGSCTPPTCPSGWSSLGVTGNVKTDAGTAGGYGSSSTSVTESSGYQERTCTF